MSGPVYALNLFDISKKEEYLAYRAGLPAKCKHGGRVVALGGFVRPPPEVSSRAR